MCDRRIAARAKYNLRADINNVRALRTLARVFHFREFRFARVRDGGYIFYVQCILNDKCITEKLEAIFRIIARKYVQRAQYIIH